MNPHGPLFKQYAESKQLNKTKLAEDLGMSKQNLYQLFKSKVFNPDTIRNIEKVLHVKWESILNQEGVNIEEVQPAGPAYDNNSMQAILQLIESNRVLCDSNKTLSDANKILAEGNTELIHMTKQSIANAAQQTQTAFEPNFGKLLAILARVGTGKHWQSEEEGIAVLHSEIYGGQVPKLSAGTQMNSDKRHTGKGS